MIMEKVQTNKEMNKGLEGLDVRPLVRVPQYGKDCAACEPPGTIGIQAKQKPLHLIGLVRKMTLRGPSRLSCNRWKD